MQQPALADRVFTKYLSIHAHSDHFFIFRSYSQMLQDNFYTDPQED
jgi:hypothetical protein